MTDIWNYRDQTWTGPDIVGYHVAATDGEIGTVDEATADADVSYVIVDTGPWIFDRRVMLPGGLIERIDVSEKKIYVDRTKDQIKHAPEFDPDTYRDVTYRNQLADYYGRNI